jgi:hypothetical protein
VKSREREGKLRRRGEGGRGREGGKEEERVGEDKKTELAYQLQKYAGEGGVKGKGDEAFKAAASKYHSQPRAWGGLLGWSKNYSSCCQSISPLSSVFPHRSVNPFATSER